MSGLYDDLVDGYQCDPYDVTCARCGKIVSSENAMIEEGDEWECEPCWEIQESKQMIRTIGLDLTL